MLNHQNLFRIVAISIMLCLIAVSGYARPLSFYQESSIDILPMEQEIHYRTLALYHARKGIVDQAGKALAMMPDAKNENLTVDQITLLITELIPITIDKEKTAKGVYTLALASTINSDEMVAMLNAIKNNQELINHIKAYNQDIQSKAAVVEDLRTKVKKATPKTVRQAFDQYSRALFGFGDGVVRVFISTGINFSAIKKYSDAANEYSTIIKLYPSIFPEAYFRRALAKTSLPDNKAALADLNTAIKLNPKVSDAYEWRGSIQMGDKKLVEAIADFTKAIELNPKAHWAYSQRSYALSQQNKKREALQDVDKAIEFAPDVVKANNYMARGSIYEELGEFMSALRDYETSVTMGNKLAEPYADTMRKKLQTFASLDGSQKKKWQPRLRGYYSLKKFMIKYENGTTLTNNDIKTEGYIKFDDNNNFITVARLGNQEISLKGRSELRMIDDYNGLFVAVTDKGVEEGKVYFPDSEEFTLTYNKLVNGQNVVETYTYSQKSDYMIQ